MARGSKTGFSDLKPVFAQIKGLKKGETARIEFTVHNPDYENDNSLPKFLPEGHESGISGKLVGVVDKTYEYEGEDILQAQLILEDEEVGEVYFLSFGMSWVGRNIINSLAGCNSIGNIDISVWNDKATGYAKVHVKNNDEKTEWGYTYDFLKEKITVQQVKEKGKIVDRQDTWELDLWLIEEVLMKEIAGKLPKRSTSSSEDKADEAPKAAPAKQAPAAAAPAPEVEAEEAPAKRKRPGTAAPAAKAPTSITDVEYEEVTDDGGDCPF